VVVNGYNPVENKIYLLRTDAMNARQVLQDNPPWKNNSYLTIAERTLVLAFGVTDSQVPPEALVVRNHE
jgi:hypothetical protein